MEPSDGEVAQHDVLLTLAAHNQDPPNVDSTTWVRRLAGDMAWLGWGWRQAPLPLKAVVWGVALFIVGGIAAGGDLLGLPAPGPDLSNLIEHWRP
jgi:hypothetical protein